MEYIVLCLLGVFFTITGIITYRGNIMYIHWYNRWKVSKEDIPAFAKVMGIGIMIMGICIALTAILQMFFEREVFWWITVIGVVAGLICLIYGLMKYNKGIL